MRYTCHLCESEDLFAAIFKLNLEILDQVENDRLYKSLFDYMFNIFYRDPRRHYAESFFIDVKRSN